MKQSVAYILIARGLMHRNIIVLHALSLYEAVGKVCERPPLLRCRRQSALVQYVSLLQRCSSVHREVKIKANRLTIRNRNYTPFRSGSSRCDGGPPQDLQSPAGHPSGRVDSRRSPYLGEGGRGTSGCLAGPGI